jgi:hypothetical protein
MVRFTFPKTLTPIEEIIPGAILENVDAMLNPPIRNVGVKGIEKWSKELLKYPKLIPEPKALAHALMMHYIYIETGGSGGAIFRQIYSDFLREAGNLMNHDGMLRASDEFGSIVELWRKVANGLLPDEYSALRELREIQWGINSELETKGLSALDSVKVMSEKVPALLEEAAQSEVRNFPEFIIPVTQLLKQISEAEENTLSRLAACIS